MPNQSWPRHPRDIFIEINVTINLSAGLSADLSATAPSQPTSNLGSDASGGVAVVERSQSDSGGRRSSTAAYSSSQPSISDSASNAAADEFNAGATAVSVDTTSFDLPRPSGGILKWIPKGARLAASNVLIKLLQAVTSRPDDVVAWRRLLGVAGVALVKPERGGKSRNFTSLVLKQLHSYESDDTVTMSSQK